MAECCRLVTTFHFDELSYACRDKNAATPCDTTVTDYQRETDVTLHPGAVVGLGNGDATDKQTCDLKGVETEIDIETQEWGTICLLNTIYSVTNWLFYFFITLAIAVGVIAGYLFMTAAGDETKLSQARGMLTYMAVGLVVAALTKALPMIIRLSLIHI